MGRTFTPEELIEELCKLHNRDRWPNSAIGIVDGPLRRALKAAGLVESYRPGLHAATLKWRWRMTAKGREALVNHPGSGITRREPMP
jgi:hypothetical protein